MFGGMSLLNCRFVRNEAVSLLHMLGTLKPLFFSFLRLKGSSASTIEGCSFEGNKFDNIARGTSYELTLSNLALSCGPEKNISLVFKGIGLFLNDVKICSLSLKSGTLSVQSPCLVGDLSLEGGDVFLEGRESSLEVEGDFRWKSGKIQVNLLQTYKNITYDLLSRNTMETK